MSQAPPLPNVARAGGIMMFSLFLSRVLAVVRDQAMVVQFGRNAETDAYRLAFQIPDLLFFLIAGGALSSAFIPVFSEYLHTERERDAWKIFSVVVTVMSVVVIAFIAFAWVFAYPLTEVVAGGKGEELRPLIVTMSRILLPSQFAFFIGGLMFGTLYARQVFAIPGLGPNIYNLGIIFGAIVISHFVSPGIVGMAWGALGGAIVGNFLMPWYAMRKIGVQFKPSFDVSHPGVKKVFKLMLPVVLGLSLPGVYGMIMQGFGSYFPDGTNTALDIANKLMQAPLAIFGQSFALAVFPALTQFFAQQRMDMYRKQLAGTLRTVLYVTVLISVLLAVLAPDIVTFLFRWGKHFQSADADAVAKCLEMFSIGIFAWCLHPVLMRAFFAVHDSVTPIVIGTLTTFVFVGLAFAFTHTPLGYAGLPLASSISALILSSVLMVAVVRKIGDVELPSILKTLVKSAIASVIVGSLAWLALRLAPVPQGVGGNLLAGARVGVVGLCCVWIYYFITKRMGMNEAAYVSNTMSRISRKLRRAPADPPEPPSEPNR